MNRYTNLLADGMKERGHQIEIWKPKSVFNRLAKNAFLKKWAGYVDQYLLFPLVVKNRLATNAQHTLFVLTDHALGPWLPLVKNKPHVIHCHDFLAQKSALRQIPENVTSWTGIRYQQYIRSGYTKGKNFISVSHKTRQDLHEFINVNQSNSTVVYNGINKLFKPIDKAEARAKLSLELGVNLVNGYLLHIGGNQWYKNRQGVVEIYNAFRCQSASNLPLLLIGEPSSENLKKVLADSKFINDIYILSERDDEFIRLGYSGASLFLFPSLAEGFGWPIIEAMACGCPVLTTNEAPMTEVAGSAAYFISRRPNNPLKVTSWASNAATVANHIVNLPEFNLYAIIKLGFKNAARFNSDQKLNEIESIYNSILQNHKKQ
ncbi:MAG: mannosyl transferase [Sphingobacteriales bacterium]|nr:mannosyl transferase [Sphingobacteriales bacterium]